MPVTSLGDFSIQDPHFSIAGTESEASNRISVPHQKTRIPKPADESGRICIKTSQGDAIPVSCAFSSAEGDELSRRIDSSCGGSSDVRHIVTGSSVLC